MHSDERLARAGRPDPAAQGSASFSTSGTSDSAARRWAISFGWWSTGCTHSSAVRRPWNVAQQVVVRDARRQAEAVDRLVRRRERIAALEADEERPGRDQQPGAALVEPPLHLAQVLLRPRASPAVARRSTCRGTSASSRGRSRARPGGPSRSRRRAAEAATASASGASGALRAVEDPVVDEALPLAELERLHRVVQRERVDHEVGLVGERVLEGPEQLREVRARGGRSCAPRSARAPAPRAGARARGASVSASFTPCPSANESPRTTTRRDAPAAGARAARRGSAARCSGPRRPSGWSRAIASKRCGARRR